MPASYARAARIASFLGATFVLLGVGLFGVATPNHDATRDLISAAQIVSGRWLLLRSAPAPVES
jgi:hypothetical protein